MLKRAKATLEPRYRRIDRFNKKLFTAASFVLSCALLSHAAQLQTLPGGNILVVSAPGSGAGEVHLLSPEDIGLQGGSWHEHFVSHGMATESSRFGTALAVGDFNGDDQSDLAVGSPDDSSLDFRAGRVLVFYTAAQGLRAPQVLYQQGLGAFGKSEEGDNFGHVLGGGDFNADGYDDLVVTAIAEAYQYGYAGAISVVYGSKQGLTKEHARTIFQGVTGAEGSPEEDTLFGFGLKGADLDGDGYDDLAVGVPSVAGHEGAVQVFFGSEQGITTKNDLLITQASLGLSPRGRFMGQALEVGRFDASGKPSLVVSIAEGSGRGLVLLQFGPDKQVALHSVVSFHDIDPTAQEDEAFGNTLAVGNFDGDAFDDLAVGLSAKAVAAQGRSSSAGEGLAYRGGAVAVVYGSSSGLNKSRTQLFHQGSSLQGHPVQGQAKDYASYGQALKAARLNDDDTDDLVIGVAFSEVGGYAYAGAVNLVYGTERGLTGLGNRLIDRSTLGLTQEKDTVFGYALEVIGK